MEVSGELHAPNRFTFKERAPNTHWIGGWVGFRAGLEAVEQKKVSCPAGNLTPSVQTAARHYTDGAMQEYSNLHTENISYKSRGSVSKLCLCVCDRAHVCEYTYPQASNTCRKFAHDSLLRPSPRCSAVPHDPAASLWRSHKSSDLC
jgi:hypothetical protein